LASGSPFSREIKLWDLKAESMHRPVLEHESFVADFEFTIHSNDLLAVKEASLKGENRMMSIDLTHSVFNLEKDESRAHSSLFFTNSSMSAIDQCDYLNKFLVCGYDGTVMLSRANDSRFWISKYKLMNNSYAVS
jgi:hypothetical protein